jgi:hypothetical protein
MENGFFLLTGTGCNIASLVLILNIINVVGFYIDFNNNSAVFK